MTASLVAVLVIVQCLFVFAWSVDRIGVLANTTERRDGTRLACMLAAVGSGAVVALVIAFVLLGLSRN